MKRAIFIPVFISSLFMSSLCLGWGGTHVKITEAAYECLGQWEKDLFNQTATDPIWGDSVNIADELKSRYCYNPDTHDGPGGTDIEIKRKISLVLYGEVGGEYAVPDPYEDGSAVWTYHYFSNLSTTHDQAYRGAKWYLKQIVDAFRNDNPIVAAQLMGGWAHAVEDRSSPYHCFDGRDSERYALFDSFDFWVCSDAGVVVDKTGYVPVLLGTDIETAATEFANRLDAVNAYSRELAPDFVDAHVNDDWASRASSPATDAIQSLMASNDANLVADMFYTAFFLGYAPNPNATNPSPSNEAEDVNEVDVFLTWTPGELGITHDLYFGTDQDAVNNARRLEGDADGDGFVDVNDLMAVVGNWLISPSGSDPYADVSGDEKVNFVDYALVARDWHLWADSNYIGNLDVNSYGPLMLEKGITYYWRVDEVNEPNTYQGDVWSFKTVEPHRYAKIFPEADTYIHSGNPTTNYGTLQYTQVVYGTKQRTLSRFDISSIPYGSKIISATLHQWWSDAYTSGPGNFSGHKLLTDFDETTTTFENFGGGTGGVEGVDYVAEAAFTYDFDSGMNVESTFDVTDTTQQWLDNPSENKGFFIKQVNTTNGKKINSRECVTQEYRPYLEIYYDEPTSEPNDLITVVLERDDDTYIHSGHVDCVYGYEDSYLVGTPGDTTYDQYGTYKYTTIYPNGKISFFHYDLNDLGDDITIVSATLSQTWMQPWNETTHNIGFYKILSSFSEFTTTWNNWGDSSGVDYDPTPIYTEAWTPGAGEGTEKELKTIDVTSLVKSWYDNPSSNKGIVVRASGAANMAIASREADLIEDRPTLTIKFIVKPKTVVLERDADTYIHSDHVDCVYGYEDSYLVGVPGDSTYDAGGNYRLTTIVPGGKVSFFHYDINSLPDDVVITSAVLNQTWLQPWSEITHNIGFYKILSGFSEFSTTWNNWGDISGVDYEAAAIYTDSWTPGTGIGQEKELKAIEVTELVRNWYDDPNSNKGVVIRATGAANMAIASREALLLEDRPYMQLTYYPMAAVRTIECRPQHDNEVRITAPDTVSDDTANLAITKVGSSDNDVYLKFDLGSLPPGSIVVSSELMVATRNDSATSRQCELYAVADDNWVETAITWNNAPLPGTILATFLMEGGDDGYAPGTRNVDYLDVSDYIKENIDMADIQISFMLSAPNDGTGCFIRADEHSDQSEHPWAQLTVKYIVP